MQYRPYMPLDYTAGAVRQAHGVEVHPVHLQLLPDLPLQFSRNCTITPVPTEYKCSIILQHRIGSTPDHNCPVSTHPQPLPVLNLWNNGSLLLWIVMPQHPWTGPVHLWHGHNKISDTDRVAPSTICCVVDPLLVIQLDEPGM